MKSAAAILFFLLLTCCELVTEIDVPEPPRMAAVNSIFNSDSTWLVDISTTDHILSNYDFFVENPEVLLTDETGRQIDLVKLNPFDTASHYPSLLGKSPGAMYGSNSRPQPGMTYRIEVRGSNIPTATATARMPIATELLDVDIDSTHSIEFNADISGIAIPVEFTIEDPPGVPDVYFPRMFQVIEYKRYDPNKQDTVTERIQRFIELQKDIPGTEFINTDGGVEGFSDVLFDGKRHTVKLYMVNYGNWGPMWKVISLKLYLTHVDEAYSKYFRSMQLQENSRNNPFAQPVQVFSNIEGGVGIFAGSATSYWEFVK